jgi:hypothetical protein
MRIESSVTSISWIPREAVEGLAGVAFDIGFAHYDSPPPPVLEDLDAMRKADRFRFANELRAWVEVVDGCGVTGSSSDAGGQRDFGSFRADGWRADGACGAQVR